MIVKAYPPRMTPEQFEELPDSQGLELIDGIVKEKNMGTENGAIQARIVHHLTLTVYAAKLGEILDTEAMYQCFPTHPKRVRKPDISFIRQDRLPDGRVPVGICRFRPDLAIEVVSPNDTYEEVEEKLADYFDAGVPLIWVVTPKTRTVLVYQADGTARRFRDTDDLTADPVIPNFRVRIEEFFP
ncbi:MAG: Uma2 family endonuclease, partial [Planctomycetia bacterium]|nr:Uma2 family endonuclease [Planctomycetia bacterium]